jgi:hypothetical protein
VLAGVTASPAPPAAACDMTASAGEGVGEPPEFMRELVGREPPYARWFAAFDPTTHSVTVIGQYGDGERMAAGSLDVCTDTWSPIDSDLRHPDTGETGWGARWCTTSTPTRWWPTRPRECSFTTPRSTSGNTTRCPATTPGYPSTGSSAPPTTRRPV